MKKGARRTLLTATAVAAVITLGLTTTTVINAVATGVENGQIESYGQKVSVDGRQMNVLISGDGPETIVMLPGFGTAAPALDFEPLVANLARDHRVIVVEPFGYGLSDGTDEERTTASIVTEVHDALVALDVDNYVLMGHSIAGIYAIEFAHRYPDEMTAFVGIDSSVPGQPNMDAQFPIGLFAAAKGLGLARFLSSFGDSGYDDSHYSAHAQKQLGLLSNRNSLSATYLNEMAHISSNFREALGTSFPTELPLLLFVESDNTRNPDWLPLHERQAAEVTDGTVVPVPGEHYLHHSHAADIAKEFRKWMDARSM